MQLINRKKIRYFYVRFLRQSGSPDEMARSAAVGLFVGFAFPIGIQIPLAIIFAYLFKARKILSCIFTLPTNAYTVIFIYPVQCWIGGKLCGISISFRELKGIFTTKDGGLFGEGLFELGKEIAITFFAGGLLFAIITATAGYFIVYGIITNHRRKVQNKLNKKLIARHENIN
jgi:uncharacterized protein (DUF2062 family)